MLQREVTLRIRTRRPPVDTEAALAFALDAMSRLGLEGSVAIEVCGPARMAELNRLYRKTAGSTDVLAFLGGESDETGQRHVGDLALCTAVVATNGERFGHGFEAEFKKVLLHGMLHLAGYDHETDQGQMRRRERALASCWGLPR